MGASASDGSVRLSPVSLSLSSVLSPSALPLPLLLLISSSRLSLSSCFFATHFFSPPSLVSPTSPVSPAHLDYESHAPLTLSSASAGPCPPAGVCPGPEEIVLLCQSHGPTMNVYIANRLSSPAQSATCASALAPPTDRQETGKGNRKQSAQQVQTGLNGRDSPLETRDSSSDADGRLNMCICTKS